MALVVNRDATVVVRAPWRTPVGYIEDFVCKNSPCNQDLQVIQKQLLTFKIKGKLKGHKT